MARHFTCDDSHEISSLIFSKQQQKQNRISSATVFSVMYFKGKTLPYSTIATDQWLSCEKRVRYRPLVSVAEIVEHLWNISSQSIDSSKKKKQQKKLCFLFLVTILPSLFTLKWKNLWKQFLSFWNDPFQKGIAVQKKERNHENCLPCPFLKIAENLPHVSSSHRWICVPAQSVVSKSSFSLNITKTYLYNFDPLNPIFI